MSKIKWDTDRMDASLKQLKQERQNLTEYRNYLQTLRDVVSQNWQSPAGRQYLERIGTETKDLSTIITLLDEQITALQSVVQQCYKTCEQEIKSKLNSLVNSI